MQLWYIVILIVVDSSTLILMAKVSLLDIFLDDYPGRVAVPKAVEAECLVSARPDAALIRERIRERRIVVEKVRSVASVAQLRKDFNLGQGEAECLALALEKKRKIVATDDRSAIRACKLLRLKFVTAIAVLIRATEKGVLGEEEAKHRLEKLAAYGRYHRLIVEDAFRRLGE